MVDEPNVTDTPTEDGGQSFVTAFADDSVATEDVAGAGAEGSGVGKEKAQEAPKAEGAVPAGTPAPEVKKENLQEYKYALNPEHREYLVSRGLATDKGLDVDKLISTFKEKDKYFTEVNTALSNTRTQLQSLRVNSGNKPAPTDEEIRSSYNEALAELQSHYNVLDRARKKLSADPQAHGEDIAEIDKQMQRLVQIDAANQKQRDKQLRDLERMELRKELGLSLPNSDEISPDRAKTVANENFEKYLTPKEIGDKAFLSKVIQPIQPLVHKIAAFLYPNLYDAQNPTSDKSQEATYRVMMDEQVTQLAVDYGKAKMVAERAEAEKQAHGVAEYQRGRADLQKELNAGGPAPSIAPVKKMAVAEGAGDGGQGFIANLVAAGDF